MENLFFGFLTGVVSAGPFGFAIAHTIYSKMESAYAVGYKDGQNGNPFLGKVSN